MNSRRTDNNQDDAPSNIKVLPYKDMEFKTVAWSDVSKQAIDVFLLTADDHSFRAAFQMLDEPKSADSGQSLGPVYFGDVGKNSVALCKSSMGAAGVTGAVATCSEVIKMLNPKAVVSLGICFGMERGKVKLGDVLVSSKVAFCGPVRVNPEGTKNRRGAISECDARLYRLFEDGKVGWKGLDNSTVEPAVHTGELLSGPELIDDKKRKEELRRSYPEALGGEMEGEGGQIYLIFQVVVGSDVSHRLLFK